jgi:MFS transporter, ACS family, D-galactonate transporter
MQVSENFRRWAVVGLLFVGMVISYMDRGNINIAAVPLMNEFGFSTAQTGLLMSMFFWTYGGFQVPAGHLIDRFGIRRIYAAAMLMWCAATACMGLARGFGELAVLRLLLGIGEAVSPLASMAYIKRNFDEREQGLPTGIYVAGIVLGPAVGAIAGTWLLDRSGWRNMFVITGLAGCLWLAPWWLLASDSRSSRQSVDSATPRTSLREFLTTPVAWGLAVSVFFYSYYWYFYLSWIPTYLVLKHDMPNVRMGMTMAAPLAGMAVVNLFSGALADRVTGREGNAIRVRKSFVCAGFISASFLAVLAWVDKGGPVLPVLIASLMGVGIAAGNYWALSQAASPRELIGRALGFQNMAAQVAGAAAPLLTGLILGPERDFGTGILIAGICPLIAVTAILLLVRVPTPAVGAQPAPRVVPATSASPVNRTSQR